jgi:DNA-binding Lrp family transcriptional regulator
MTEEIDAKDVEILETLRKDSRTSMGSIGISLGKDKATISRRIARMEEDKVIMNHSLEIDPSKLNIMKSLLYLQVVGSPVSLVIDILKKFEGVRHIYKAFGDHNLICELYTKSVDDLYELIQMQVLNIPSIQNVQVDVIVERMVIDENADLKLYKERRK